MASASRHRKSQPPSPPVVSEPKRAEVPEISTTYVATQEAFLPRRCAACGRQGTLLVYCTKREGRVITRYRKCGCCGNTVSEKEISEK